MSERIALGRDFGFWGNSARVGVPMEIERRAGEGRVEAICRGIGELNGPLVVVTCQHQGRQQRRDSTIEAVSFELTIGRPVVSQDGPARHGGWSEAGRLWISLEDPTEDEVTTRDVNVHIVEGGRVVPGNPGSTHTPRYVVTGVPHRARLSEVLDRVRKVTTTQTGASVTVVPWARIERAEQGAILRAKYLPGERPFGVAAVPASPE